jgi:3-isopropylmalate/(R)-2-methylmalate dehydratase large subunit
MSDLRSEPLPEPPPEQQSRRTLYDKLLQSHCIHRYKDGSSLVLVDRVLLHERTGAVALTNLRADQREIMAPATVFCTIDHIADTRLGRPQQSRMPGGEVFIDAMRTQTSDMGLTLFDIDDPRQGIVHVIAPEQGIALPGITLVCPDSHTCTLGGLGALAWGIGSTDCEHALATRTLRIKPLKQLKIVLSGEQPAWISAKDIILHLIATHSASRAVDHVIEFSGPAIDAMDIEQRLTLCNMGVEMGAFTALIAPDQKTINYLHGRSYAPTHEWQSAVQYWSQLHSDAGACFDDEIQLDISTLSPTVTWGTSPEHAVSVDQPIPDNADTTRRKALDYMDLQGGQHLTELPIDTAYIGSCTNARLSDLRRAASILKDNHVAPGVKAICVPGSTRVKNEAEAEGLHQVFIDAGFEWNESGCAMCFYAGGDSFGNRSRVISSTNRNFEGRQGPGSKTHLASPETVALSAIKGKIANLKHHYTDQQRDNP